jgi:hypothetical protein
MCKTVFLLLEMNYLTNLKKTWLKFLFQIIKNGPEN